MKLCTVDGCHKPLRARGYCAAHWALWRKYGKPEKLARIVYELCTADDCPNPPRSRTARYCEMHYYRLRRNGKLEVDHPQRESRGECTVDGCGLDDCGPHGLCPKHRARQVRHGDPLAYRPNPLPSGPDNKSWTGEQATNKAVHQRLRKLRGSARHYACVDCGGPAAHWSYDHKASDERYCPEHGPYTTNLDHYEPRCVSCHKRYDLNKIKGSERRYG